MHPDDPQAAAKEGIRAIDREDIILLSREESQVESDEVKSRTNTSYHVGPRPAEGKAKIGPVYYMETSDTTHEYYRQTAPPGTDIVHSHEF